MRGHELALREARGVIELLQFGPRIFETAGADAERVMREDAPAAEREIAAAAGALFERHAVIEQLREAAGGVRLQRVEVSRDAGDHQRRRGDHRHAARQRADRDEQKGHRDQAEQQAAAAAAEEHPCEIHARERRQQQLTAADAARERQREAGAEQAGEREHRERVLVHHRQRVRMPVVPNPPTAAVTLITMPSQNIDSASRGARCA